MRRRLVLTLVACVALACSDDDGARPTNDTQQSDYGDLSQREHVLANLETSWNQRNITEFAELLHEDFVFFFADGDVGGVPESWGRVEEIASASNMFTGGGINPITSIDLDIRTAGGQWVDTTLACCPDETVSIATVAYTFIIQAEPDITYVSSGTPEMLVVVRETGDGWALYQWRDLAQNNVMARVPSGTEASSLSKIKAVYQ